MTTQIADVYEFGGCRLDVPRRILTRDGAALPLAPKTFELLLLLLQSQGRALSKQELMSALWPDVFVEEANLSFQIAALRKAPRNGSRPSRSTATALLVRSKRSPLKLPTRPPRRPRLQNLHGSPPPRAARIDGGGLRES
jgi:hypothetical protein